MKHDPLIIISGPTATGKSRLAITLYDELLKKGITSEIVNFDSMLFYKGLNIGTAKPTEEELKSVPHHLIDIADIKNPVTAFLYQKMATETLKKIYEKNRVPILVGGSGFYLRGLIKGMFESELDKKQTSEEVLTRYKSEGIAPFQKILEENDPISFNRLHPNDHYRILRAAEFFLINHYPISVEHSKAQERAPYDFSKNLSHPWKILHLYLDLPKEEHLKIISDRTTAMINGGLIEEVKSLLASGYTGLERPLRSIGYSETFDFLTGIIKSTDELSDAINISTRQLAKSQRTFFKKITPKESFHPVLNHKQIQQLTLTFLEQFFPSKLLK